MKYNLLIIQNYLKEFSDELNNTDWSAFPIGEEYGVWIPLAIVLVVFFGFIYLAQIIEKEEH